MALGRGCCCTCKVIVALSHTVCCSDKDGGFMEKSARVRAAAAEALERCIASGCCVPELPAMVPGTVPPVVPKVPEGPEGPEGGTGDPKKDDKEKDKASAQFVSVAQAKPGPDARPKPPAPMSFADYYMAVPRVPRDQVLTNARRALEIGHQIGLGMSHETISGDYEAAGVATPAETLSMSHTPPNLWDRMTRRTPQPRVQTTSMMMGEAAVTPVSTSTPAPMLAPPAAPAAKPVMPAAPIAKSRQLRPRRHPARSSPGPRPRSSRR